MELGNFREDLFYRLNVLSIEIPSLRKRKEDIRLLFESFIEKYCHKHNRKIKPIDKGIFEILQGYNWPGNVRELQNITEKLVVTAENEMLKKEDVENLIAFEFNRDNSAKGPCDNLTCGTLDEITYRIIVKVLEEENYNKTRAACRLGVDRGTLNRRLNRG